MSESVYKTLVYKWGKIGISIWKHQVEWAKCGHKCKGLCKYRERVIVSAGTREGSLEEVALKLAWKDV